MNAPEITPTKKEHQGVIKSKKNGRKGKNRKISIASEGARNIRVEVGRKTDRLAPKVSKACEYLT